jgi:hypothetical protein
MLQPETRTLRHPAASASVRPAPDAFFLTLAPDWICEVLSPGSARFDCKKKMPICSQTGVRLRRQAGIDRPNSGQSTDGDETHRSSLHRRVALPYGHLLL